MKPSPAQACSCMVPLSVEDEMERLDAVFMGKVTKIKDIGLGQQPKRVFFDVSKVWKGENVNEIVVVTGNGAGDCGFHFEEGEEYIVYAHQSNSYSGARMLTTSICDLTSNVNPEVENPLYPNQVVYPPGEGKVPSQEESSDSVLWYAGIWGVFSIVSGLLLWRLIR